MVAASVLAIGDNSGILYWQVGEYISRKIETAEWGDGVVDQLASMPAQGELIMIRDLMLWVKDSDVPASGIRVFAFLLVCQEGLDVSVESFPYWCQISNEATHSAPVQRE